jgi:hypothetical protein
MEPGGRVRQRLPGAGVDGVKTTLAVARKEAMQVAAAVPVLGSSCGDGELASGDLQDGDPRFRHARSLSPSGTHVATQQRPIN